MNDTTHNALEIDISAGETVAFVSSRQDDRQTNWTELNLVYLPSAGGRCFFSEAIGKTTVRGQKERRMAVYVGQIARAMDLFDEGNLRDLMAIQVADWLERNPGRLEEDLKQLREVERRPAAAPIGFTGGGGLIGALRWLFGDQTEEFTAGRLSEDLERDFGVPARTVRYALDMEEKGKPLTGWAKGFVSALLFFDRRQFQASAPKGGA